jgi:hypothetical protein
MNKSSLLTKEVTFLTKLFFPDAYSKTIKGALTWIIKRR